MTKKIKYLSIPCFLEYNPCDPNPCLANENCVVLIDSNYKCEPFHTVDLINLCDIKPNICRENSICTYNPTDNSYFCRCIDIRLNNITEQGKSCNYPISYREFFETETTSNLITSPTTTIAASMQIDQLERNSLVESKGNFKLLSSTFNTENVRNFFLKNFKKINHFFTNYFSSIG